MSAGSDALAGTATQRRWEAVMMDNYGTPPVTLVRGQGARVWDEQGREYLDLLAGIAVNALGHAHPKVVSAVNRQMSTLAHTSNLAVNLPALELAERLSGLLTVERPGDTARVFFCNSGAEANEAAFKLSRLTGRKRIVAAQGSFHGRTMGALALTGQPAKADPFRPLPGDVTFVPFGDEAMLTDAVDGQTAAVILEPVQGEAGVIPAQSGYLAAAQAAARENGALFILDEVQTGIGRCGRWFAHQGLDPALEPDVVTLAKGLGGGLPMGAVVGFGAAGELLSPGTHGSTFGGNPVAAAAALAVLDAIESEGLLERAQRLGESLRSLLSAVPGVKVVRGDGLLLGVVLTAPVAKQAEALARERGLLVNAAAPDVVRLAPPLVLSDAQAQRAAAVLSEVLFVLMSQR